MSWALGWNRLIDRCGNDDGVRGRCWDCALSDRLEAPCKAYLGAVVPSACNASREVVC